MKQVLESVAALVLLLGLIGVIVFGLLVPAVNRLSDADDRIAALEETVSAFRARATDRAGATVQIVSDRVLLPGPSLALSAAAAQEVLSEAAARTGTEFDRVSIEEPVPADGLVKIVLGARVSAPVGKLADLIHGIESGMPYLVIEALRIRRDRGSGGAATGTVSAEISLAGYASSPAE